MIAGETGADKAESTHRSLAGSELNRTERVAAKSYQYHSQAYEVGISRLTLERSLFILPGAGHDHLSCPYLGDRITLERFRNQIESRVLIKAVSSARSLDQRVLPKHTCHRILSRQPAAFVALHVFRGYTVHVFESPLLRSFVL